MQLFHEYVWILSALQQNLKKKIMIKQRQTGNQAEAATYYGQIKKQINIIEKSNYICFY